MPNDHKTPRPPRPLPSTPLSLPDDLTIQSLSRLSAKTLSPDHPAAQLKTLNDRFHAMMHSEGDQTKTLMRQTQTLDAIFHFLIQQSLTPDNPDLMHLALALRSQRQCNETAHNVHTREYMQTLQALMENGSTDRTKTPARRLINEAESRLRDRGKNEAERRLQDNNMSTAESGLPDGGHLQNTNFEEKVTNELKDNDYEF